MLLHRIWQMTFRVLRLLFLPGGSILLKKKTQGVMKVQERRPPCPSGRYWQVRAGDTLYSIARQLGTTLDELLRLNPGVDPSNLRIGQFLCLPEEFPPCPSGVYWVVAPGDTLYRIAQATGTTVDALLQANPGIDPLNLQVGQKICLPG